MAADISPLTFYPWQLVQAQQWLAQKERFAHAWLIHGLAGIGKTQFAKAGAAALLCEQPMQHLACGQCVSCQWVQAGNHPDLRHLRPDAMTAEENPEYLSSTAAKSPSKHIRVEQLRELNHWFTTATHRGGHRVLVLYPAESLNSISANALLKVLEEPPAHTVLLLVVNQYEQLLPTIISRCRRLTLAIPTQQQSVDWLAERIKEPLPWLAAVGGAPVAAYHASKAHDHPYPAWLVPLCEQLAKTHQKAVLTLAPQLEAQSTAQWLDVLQRLYVDLQLTQAQQAPRYYPSLSALLQRIVEQTTAQALQQHWKWLLAQKRHANHPLNTKLLVHTALMRLAAY